MPALKHPTSSYPERLSRFLALMETVKGKTGDTCLWEVMDSVAFADTEAALQTALYNASLQGPFQQA